MREVIGRNTKCPLCGRAFSAPSHTLNSSFVHDKAGRVHLLCSFKKELWKKWMQSTGQIPTPVDVEVVDSKKDSK